MSNVSLESLGISEYKKAIDDALDVAKILVAVGTSRENLEWRWVRYEWDSFFNDILSGVKPTGRVFAYVEGVRILDLPRSLRQAQTFIHEDDSLETLSNFITNALSKIPEIKQIPSENKISRPIEPLKITPLSKQYDVYFIYSYNDRAYVNELSKEMKKRGISWTDGPSGSYPPEVVEQLRKSRFVIYIDSRNAHGMALYQELDIVRGGNIPIVPLKIEYVPPRKQNDPLRFVEKIQCLDVIKLSVSEVADEILKMINN